jgi:hypothetical protein
MMGRGLFPAPFFRTMELESGGSCRNGRSLREWFRGTTPGRNGHPINGWVNCRRNETLKLYVAAWEVKQPQKTPQ